MKKLLIVPFLCLFFLVSAQTLHDPSDNMTSPNWELIGDIEFKVVKKTQLYPMYKENIKKHAGKPFVLEGYMVPLKDGMTQTKFMFSTLPINQCMFCGQNGNPIMIMVEMAKPIKFTFKPIGVQGILKLENIDGAITPPVSLQKAEVID